MNQMQPKTPIAAEHCDLYDAKVLGAPFKVFLSGGVHHQVDPKTGKVVTEIEDLKGLVAQVVRSRVVHPRKLSGHDCRFIRTALHHKSSEMAKLLDLTPEHYSRCESGVKPLTPNIEKQMRMIAFLEISLLNVARTQERNQLRPGDNIEEKAHKALASLKDLFFGLKIQPVFDPCKELRFVFERRCVSEITPCKDGEWSDADDKAA